MYLGEIRKRKLLPATSTSCSEPLFSQPTVSLATQPQSGTCHFSTRDLTFAFVMLSLAEYHPGLYRMELRYTLLPGGAFYMLYGKIKGTQAMRYLYCMVRRSLRPRRQGGNSHSFCALQCMPSSSGSERLWSVTYPLRPPCTGTHRDTGRRASPGPTPASSLDPHRAMGSFCGLAHS